MTQPSDQPAAPRWRRHWPPWESVNTEVDVTCLCGGTVRVTSDPEGQPCPKCGVLYRMRSILEVRDAE